MSDIARDDYDKYISNNPLITCRELIHPDSECLGSKFTFIWRSLRTTAKFYTSLYAAKVLLDLKSPQRFFPLTSYLLKFAKSYAQSVVFGASAAWVYMCATCILCKLCNGVKYPNLAFTAGMIGGLTGFMEQKNSLHLQLIYLVVLDLVAGIRLLEKWQHIKRTRAKDTIAFMTCSALLMYLLRTQPRKLNINLWLYKHGASDTSIVKGFAKYFLIGFVFATLRDAMKRFKQARKNPIAVLNALIDGSSLKLGVILGGYVSIFRFIMNTLLGQTRKEFAWHHLVAGFLSGAIFFVEPNLQLFSMAAVTIVQLLLNRSMKLSLFRTTLLHAFFFGLAFHIKMFYPSVCPGPIYNMIAMCSDYVAEDITEVVTSEIVRHNVNNNPPMMASE